VELPTSFFIKLLQNVISAVEDPAAMSLQMLKHVEGMYILQDNSYDCETNPPSLASVGIKMVLAFTHLLAGYSDENNSLHCALQGMLAKDVISCLMRTISVSACVDLEGRTKSFLKPASQRKTIVNPGSVSTPYTDLIDFQKELLGFSFFFVC
jgi:hypothetical protein